MNPYVTPKADAEIISGGPYAIGNEVLTKVSLRTPERRCIVTGLPQPPETKAEMIRLPKKTIAPFGRFISFSGFLDPAFKKKSRQKRVLMFLLGGVPLGIIYFLLTRNTDSLAPRLLLIPIIIAMSLLRKRLFPQDRIKASKTDNGYYRLKNLHPDFVASLPPHPDSTFLSNS